MSDAVEATGFLTAGAYDSVGQNQLSLAMRAVVRADELEDMVGTVGQTFLGLTVHCARCHDHKFDPIRQTEYYRLASSLGGVSQGERDLSSDRPEADRACASRLAATGRAGPGNRGSVREQIAAARKSSASAVVPPTPIAAWNFDEGLNEHVGSLAVIAAWRCLAHATGPEARRQDRLRLDRSTGSKLDGQDARSLGDARQSRPARRRRRQPPGPRMVRSTPSSSASRSRDAGWPGPRTSSGPRAREGRPNRPICSIPTCRHCLW